MRRLVSIICVALLAAVPVASAEWYRVMLEAGANTDELLEGAISYERLLWSVTLRARDTAARDVDLVGNCFVNCSLVERAGAEVDLTLYIEPWWRNNMRHGPVLRYTRHGDQDETGFVGWRIYMEKGSRR